MAREGQRNGGGTCSDSTNNCTRGTGMLVNVGACSAAELARTLDAADDTIPGKRLTCVWQVRKQSFFAKKDQKTFASSLASMIVGTWKHLRLHQVSPRQRAQTFLLLFFSKKKALLAAATVNLQPGWATPVRRLLLVCVAAAACQQAARGATPSDFQGHWLVGRMVGSGDVGTGDDFHTLLRTPVEWREDAVIDADGTCKIVHASVVAVSTDRLQHDIWGGQTIKGLLLPRTVVARSFGAGSTPVFDDGGKGCARGVMLSTHQMLLMFSNGYLYLLDRDPNQPAGSKADKTR